MKFAKIIEQYTTVGEPLYEQADKTVVEYIKYEFSQRGEGYPVEFFSLYDPKQFSPSRLTNHINKFRANVDILLNQDGSIYPQISIIQNKQSYSIWDGEKRKGTSGLLLLKLAELNEQQQAQIKTIFNLLKTALPIMIKQNSENKTLRACLSYFGCQQQKSVVIEKDPVMGL